MKPNPFDKYLQPEDKIHLAVVRYIQLQYPKVPFHHSPNEAKRSKFEQYKIKLLGTRSGFPDLFIPVARSKRHGLVIELKAGKNKPTPAQAAWIEEFASQNYYACVCYSFDEAKRVIDLYMNEKITA